MLDHYVNSVAGRHAELLQSARQHAHLTATPERRAGVADLALATASVLEQLSRALRDRYAPVRTLNTLNTLNTFNTLSTGRPS
ncbi:MAG: hypothetical protein K1X39_12890 [Thermoflexales bacterium]|nr:hypothetical protein [Thermoflexales bacterium]